MPRPPVPDQRSEDPKKNLKGRDPWEYDPELAKYNAIRDFMKSCGELSDVTDKFHHYEARWKTLNRVTGISRPLRIGMYNHYKKNSLNHLRMAVNEIVRLLSQPKVVVHGQDFIRDDTEEPGFFANLIEGGKKMLGMKSEQRSQDVNNGRY
jgi:hypothetical protein